MNTGPVLVDVAVKDLSGEALNWAVGKALGWVDYPDDSIEQGAWWYTDPVKAPFCERIRKVDWKPSIDWRQGGELIDNHYINLLDVSKWPSPGVPPVERVWAAALDSDVSYFGFVGRSMSGGSPLIAVCRALVDAKLGDIVKVPACLVLP